MNQTKSTYDNCLKEMFSLHRFGIKLGLDTIKDMLNILGNPHLSYRCIHIAGTNGKGSIASWLATILRDAGHRTGLYTSPHLVKFNERIQINGQPISDDRVVALYEAVLSSNKGERQATFFEFATAMALHEFALNKVEWAVIETGMGGRLDATNIIHPELTIITNISLEHKEYLGDTLSQIAEEKAGIIKHNIPVITGVTQNNVVRVIEDACHQQKAPCYRKGKDFRTRRKTNGHVDYYGIRTSFKDIVIKLVGNHQLDNAALVLAACEELIEQGIDLPEHIIQKGLSNNFWPGRLEKVLESPLVIFDGAHNLMAAKVLSDYLKNELKGISTTLVIGILDDKPYQTMLKTLVPSCQHIILTRPKINRALAPKKLLNVVNKIHSKAEIIDDVATAVQTAIERSQPSDAVCVAGSLYVVGEAKEAFAQLKLSKK
ncbi:MAG: folylpolyglutamate synthase/dihydrofolate synthase family protein [Desulfobacteraceae bacterium]|jgi:dihydrofolate synthase/folylpolyglutamate synthase